MSLSDRDEWLEADGLGGFASGTVSGIRTRRYHAQLLVASRPPSGRRVLVNGLEVWLELPGRRVALSSQRYTPDVTYPDGSSRLESFRREPWPTWRYDLGALAVEHELFVPRDRPMVALSWRLATPAPDVRLCVRPLLSGRDFHALHRENPAFRFAADQRDGRVVWQPYVTVPAVGAWANGGYAHSPDWYRSFQYDRERERGLDFVEDLASPGVFSWDLSRGPAVLLLAVDQLAAGLFSGAGPLSLFESLRDAERLRRAGCGSSPKREAGSYLIRRGEGDTLIAGYPWFGDWGRDTFISLRGLCLATDRPDRALSILLEWSEYVSEGMLPNRFPDEGAGPEYNSVDASLWFVIAVYEALQALKQRGRAASSTDGDRLLGAVDAVLDGYARGTRHGIHVESDGLLAAGNEATQLTWMDARFEGRPVTPRAGKPVEVQALWLNALWLHRERGPAWHALFQRGLASFAERFWNPGRACLFDLVDVGGQPGSFDASIRPNQIFAVGDYPCSSFGASALAAWSRSSSGPSGRRSDCARSPPRSPTTGAVTKEGCGSATKPITRERSGHGSQGLSSRRGCGCMRVSRARSRRRAAGSSSRCASNWSEGAWATFRRSPMGTPRTRRRAVLSRRGRSRSCCGCRGSSEMTKGP